MFVIDETPSGSVIMFALSRVVVAAPDCTSPTSGSFSRLSSVSPKLLACAFQFCSVNPRKYAQSCRRLCITNRFTAAAESSYVEPGTGGVAGLHCRVFQLFVHGNE